MNAREVLEGMIRTDRGDMTVHSPAEVQSRLDAYRAEVLAGHDGHVRTGALNEAADVADSCVALYEGSDEAAAAAGAMEGLAERFRRMAGEEATDARQAARDEAADWLASYPFPSSDSDWERGRDDTVAWAVRVLRNPDPQRGTAAGQGLDVRLTEQRTMALAEAKAEVVAWLLKKGREQAAWYTATLASKVDRGAVRIFLGTGHYRDAMDEHRVEVLNEALDSIRDCLRAGGQQQKGLIVARNRIAALIDGTTPEPPRRNVSHKQVAARCRLKPFEWLPVGEYANDTSAASIVSAITKGGSSILAYLPAGTFEGRSERTETGTAVSARYVGDGGEGRG